MKMSRRQERYYRLISKGHCVQCGKPTKSGFVECERCQEKRRLLNRLNNKKNRQRYIDEHRCTRCSAPLEEGDYHTCMNCRSDKTR